MKPVALLKAAVGYLRNNPEEVVTAAANAATLRFGVPIAALRWLASQSKPSKKGPQDVEVGASPPALTVGATVDAMGTPVRATAAVRVDEVTIDSDRIRVGVRLSDVKLKLQGESDAPVATLIKSGALDLSKPGNLVKFIPKRPDAIVEAEGDRIVVDLMKVPKIAKNRRVKKALSVIAPILGVRAIETDEDHLYVRLRAKPGGIGRAIEALRRD
jgi:hypothetical protein